MPKGGERSTRGEADLNPPDPLLEERLRKLEPPYKSKGEAQIGRMLDRYGLPFFYEQSLLVRDRGRERIWHPDFTVPDLAGLILEYAGMPDKPTYRAGIRHKKRVYKQNVIPALFIFPADLQGPDWPVEIYHRIQALYREIQQESHYYLKPLAEYNSGHIQPGKQFYG